MNLKSVILGIAIIILTIFVTYYGINTILPKPSYDDFCGTDSRGEICPAVCVPMYEIIDGNCTFTECGSGCGPDGIYTFSTLEQCKDGAKLSDAKKCELQNRTWIRQETQCIKAPCPQGYCDMYSKCSQELDDLLKSRSKRVFFIALPLGILIIAGGAFAFSIEAVGAGLMGGGVGTLLYGAGAYWPYTLNWIRFLLSLVGLAVLIWFVYFWNKRLEKKKRKR